MFKSSIKIEKKKIQHLKKIQGLDFFIGHKSKMFLLFILVPMDELLARGAQRIPTLSGI
jgi:hypothetical protein